MNIRRENERFVLGVLSELSKDQDKDFSEQSLKLMDNNVDNAILTSLLLSRAEPSLFTEEEEHLQESVFTILNTFYESCNQYEFDLRKDGFSELLVKAFEDSEKDSDGFMQSAKLRYAVISFVGGFLRYERLEKKYPAVMKVI